MAQVLLVFHQGLCPHHPKLHLHLLHKDCHLVHQWEILLDPLRRFMDLYCLLLRWEMALDPCLLVELLPPLLHPQLVITQWQISLLALRWEDLHQCHLHKAFQDNKCRVRVFVHPHHLLT